MNAWSHVMLTRKDGVVRVFVNGRPETAAQNYNLLQGNNSLGRHAFRTAAGTSHFKGYMDSVRIVKGLGYGAEFEMGCAWNESN